MEISKVSMIVEIDGAPCVVILPQNKLLILVDLAASLSDSGKLLVKKLGTTYNFENI